MPVSKGYVDTEYLRAAAMLVQQAKERSYSLMHVQLGQKVLDVGCGPGTDTLPLAHLVGPTGRVVGLDHDPAMIAEADKRAVEAGAKPWVEHRIADAISLPFESAVFDACRSERLFQHLPDPDRVLAEMIRVTKAGGWVVLVDTDHGAMSIDYPDVDVERRIVRVLAERLIRDGYAGRRLYGRVKRSGLAKIKVELVPIRVTDYALARQVAQLDKVEQTAVQAGIVSEEELKTWQRELKSADEQGVFFAIGCTVIVAGRKS